MKQLQVILGCCAVVTILFTFNVNGALPDKSEYQRVQGDFTAQAVAEPFDIIEVTMGVRIGAYDPATGYNKSGGKIQVTYSGGMVVDYVPSGLKISADGIISFAGESGDGTAPSVPQVVFIINPSALQSFTFSAGSPYPHTGDRVFTITSGRLIVR